MGNGMGNMAYSGLNYACCCFCAFSKEGQKIKNVCNSKHMAFNATDFYHHCNCC